MSYASSIVSVAVSFLMVSCGGGGGGGGPANPAQAPTATTSTSMTGYWRCAESTLITTNTVNTFEFVPNDVIEIWQNQIIGMPVISQSWLRPDIEVELGFLLGWYYNSGNGSVLDYHMGWDRLAQGAGQFVDYENYGLRLAAIGPDQLIGYEAAVVQESPQVSREEWTAAVRFERTTPPPQSGDSQEELEPRKRLVRTRLQKPAR